MCDRPAAPRTGSAGTDRRPSSWGLLVGEPSTSSAMCWTLVPDVGAGCRSERQRVEAGPAPTKTPPGRMGAGGEGETRKGARRYVRRRLVEERTVVHMVPPS